MSSQTNAQTHRAGISGAGLAAIGGFLFGTVLEALAPGAAGATLFPQTFALGGAVIGYFGSQ